jgi:hypothetical protein
VSTQFESHFTAQAGGRAGDENRLIADGHRRRLSQTDPTKVSTSEGCLVPPTSPLTNPAEIGERCGNAEF